MEFPLNTPLLLPHPVLCPLRSSGSSNNLSLALLDSVKDRITAKTEIAIKRYLSSGVLGTPTRLG